ncbi:MAG TPA: NDP-sugar synthase, partial [Rubrobacteraceae bacterium]|nr:NDP-sugar synthase [Rubrobacteraceae bacterium]
AAGKGTRLFPLTGVIPKPLVPVADKPILQHIFGLLARAGANEVHVTVHYLADAILGRYGEGARLGSTQIHFHREKRLMGTAGGVKRVSDAVGFDEPFVVIMGDALTDVDLRDLVAFHKRKGTAATLALTRVEDTSGYGVVELDAEKNVLSFQEKPDPHEAVSNLANTGIYVLEPEVLEKYVPGETFFDFAEDVFPALLAAGEKVVGYEGDFYWSDIGTLESYQAAQRDALSGRVAVEVPGERWGKGLWVGKTAWIHPSAYGRIEGHAVVGERAMIGRRASLHGVVAVGDDCRVSDEATIKQSVLLPGSTVGSGAHLEDCVVGPRYEVRAGECIRGGALVRGVRG